VSPHTLLIDFNKSLDPTGSDVGMISFKKSRCSTRIKLYHEKFEDVKLGKKKLIFKAKISETTFEEPINSERLS